MKISNILIAFTLVFTIACTNKKSGSEHGHSHDAASHAHPHDGTMDDHGHSHDEGETPHVHHNDDHHEQEEFTIKGDSVEVVADSTHHTHEDGSTHHNH